MISSKNIRFHASSNTYVIPKNSIFDENVAINGNVIAGSGVRFWENVKIFGNVQLGKGCVIEGNLSADNIIVGAQSKIKGNVTALENVSLFQNSAVKSIESGETITIMGGCHVGYANSKRLEIVGKANIKKIGRITKVTVRTDMIASMNDEDEEKNTLEDDFSKNEKNEFSKNDFVDSSIESLSENSVIEQSTMQTSDVIFIEEDTIENEILYPSNTPIFQVEHVIEKEVVDIETNLKINSQNNFSIPEKELSDVEIFDASEFSESSTQEVPRAQKKIETPFGTVMIDDHEDFRSMQSNEKSSIGFKKSSADLKKPSDNLKKPAHDLRKTDENSKEIIDSKAKTESDFKFKKIDYISFVSQTSESTPELKTANLQSDAQPKKKSVSSNDDAAKIFKNKEKENNQRFIFEKIESDVAFRDKQKTEEYEEKPKAQEKEQKKSNQSDDLSKTWYEERFKEPQPKKKEYPPYI